MQVIKGAAQVRVRSDVTRAGSGNHSLVYVIIICNDVTRACSNTIRRNWLTTHFLASLLVCDTIEGLILAYYDWLDRR